MEKSTTDRFLLIDQLYRQNSERILNYIRARVNVSEDAENISQEVWMRLMESDVEICIDTVTSYIFRIASNLVNDYLRRLYVRQEVDQEIQAGFVDISEITPEHELEALQLSQLEMGRIECMPQQRRIIYKMSRFEEKTVNEIADALSLSFRTVENHLRMGRHDVRTYISAIA